MPSVWKTVRVFISSTFRDMHAERDHLVKVVFPALRERLEKHRIYLDDIDLRWGVTKEQAENDQVLDLCLHEIERCRPFFIGILGERYGWTPTRLPEDAVRSFGWIQDYPGKSVTELEILHGELNSPTLSGRAFFYFRDPSALADMPEDIRRSTFTETDPAPRNKLADLKNRIRASGRPVMDPYPTRWDAQTQRLVGLEAFGERVREQLWEAIKAEHNLPDAPPPETALDPQAVELDYHERFMESRLRVHVLRRQINDALLAFSENDDTVACLVTGPSGSGKSASLARFVMDYQRTHRDALVVPHFIGASPQSTNLREMLRRFCQVLKARLGLADEVPEEVTKLAVTFREFIGKVPPDMRVVFVIDALNQLDETDRAQNLGWLPVQFPPQVKVVVSCISDSGKAEPVLEAMSRRQKVEVVIDPLDKKARRDIIQAVPSLSAKAPDDQQIEQLLANSATTNPLFLLVALEELRGFGSYERLNERIAAFPQDGDTVTAIFTQVIERLEEEFAREVVQNILTLLASARRGLSERELQELVAGLPGADDLFPILRQLRPYLLRRAGLIDFYHRNLYKAVHERYLAAEEQQRLAHARLGEYFHAQDYWLESLEEQRRRANTIPPTPRPANVRKVDELPWQFLQAADWERSEQLLTDLPFLEAKAEAGMVFDLAADFSAIIGAMPAERPLLRMLRLLEEALRRDIHFIARHPTTLFQCMWNSAWWYDCDQIVGHLRACEQAIDYSQERSQDDLLTNIVAELIEKWRGIKSAATPGFRWMRALRPPQQSLGAAFRSEVRGQLKHTSSIGCSGDGSIVVWVGGGGSDEPKGAYVWHQKMGRLDFVPLRSAPFDVDIAAEGSRIAFVFGKTTTIYLIDEDGRVASDFVEIVAIDGDAFHRVCFSPNSGYVALGLQSGHVQVTRVDDRKTLWSEVGHPGKFVRGLAWSGDTLVSGGDDAVVVVWDASNGTIRFRFANLAAEVSSVDVCDDFVAAGTGVDDFKLMDVMLEGQSINDYQMERSQVFLWDARTGREVTQLTGHREKVNSVRFMNGGTQVMSCSGGLLHGSEHSVFVWDVASGSLITNLGKQAAAVVGSCADSDGQAFFTVCWDGAVQAWDGGRVLNSHPIVSHEQEIRIIEFSPNGRRVITTSWDDPPRIWDVDSGRHIATLAGHECLIRTAWFSPDSRLILTGAGRKYPIEPMDYTARLWDVESGRCCGILEGHTSPVTLAKFSMDGKFIVTGESDVRSMVARPHTIHVWDSRTLKEIAKIGRGQPEFMISLVSGDDPERLMVELERMGVFLPPQRKTHLLPEVDRNSETRVRFFRSAMLPRDEPSPDGLILGWVPDLPNSTITPFALHSESLSFAIARGHDLRLFRVQLD